MISRSLTPVAPGESFSAVLMVPISSSWCAPGPSSLGSGARGALKPWGYHGLPAALGLPIDQAAMGLEPIALAIAAAAYAGQPTRACTQRADQAGHAWRIPGAEVPVTHDLELAVEVDHQALFPGRGIGIVGHATPRAAGSRQCSLSTAFVTLPRKRERCLLAAKGEQAKHDGPQDHEEKAVLHRQGKRTLPRDLGSAVRADLGGTGYILFALSTVDGCHVHLLAVGAAAFLEDQISRALGGSNRHPGQCPPGPAG